MDATILRIETAVKGSISCAPIHNLAFSRRSKFDFELRGKKLESNPVVLGVVSEEQYAEQDIDFSPN